MVDTKSQRLASALDTFLQASPDVEATAVITFDGLMMASALPDDMDEDRVGAMSAALLSLGEQAARGLGRGDLQQMFVEADQGFVFLMSAQDHAVLVAVTGRQAKIGFILFEMRRAADEVGGVLEDPNAAMSPEPSLDDRDILTGGGEPPEEELQVAERKTPFTVPAGAPSGFAELEGRGVGAHSREERSITDEVRAAVGDEELDDPYYVASTGRSGDPSHDHV